MIPILLIIIPCSYTLLIISAFYFNDPNAFSPSIGLSGLVSTFIVCNITLIKPDAWKKDFPFNKRVGYFEFTSPSIKTSSVIFSNSVFIYIWIFSQIYFSFYGSPFSKVSYLVHLGGIITGLFLSLILIPSFRKWYAKIPIDKENKSRIVMLFYSLRGFLPKPELYENFCVIPVSNLEEIKNMFKN